MERANTEPRVVLTGEQAGEQEDEVKFAIFDVCFH
jgi:hypothetical protein